MITIPQLFPAEASNLKPSTGRNVLIYQSKETNSEINVEEGKFYYINEQGKHKLFSTGGVSGYGSSPAVYFTCGQPIVINDDTLSGFGTGIGNTIITAEDVRANSVYKVKMYGRIEIEEESDDLINMTIKLGDTTLYSEQFALLGENVGLFISFNISVASVGASGQVYVIAPDPVGPFLTHTFPKDLQTDATAKTIDFRSDKTIDVVFESTGEDATVTILNSIITKIN